MPLSLKDRTKLEALNGKTIMYATVTYRITGIVEVQGNYILSTDVKPLKFQEADIPKFLSEILPVETRPAKIATSVRPLNADVDTTVLSELTNSLMDSLRQLDTTHDDAGQKKLGKKIKLKCAISRAATDIAKTAIIARRYT